MSLNFSLGSIAHHEAVCYENAKNDGDDYKAGDRIMTVATQQLIFITMIVGMDSITEKNWREFYVRVSMYERVMGAARAAYAGGETTPIFYTPEQIRAHVGLSTNASKRTKSQFLTHLHSIYERDTLYALRTR